ncbi:MAG: hypothetical protein IPL46_29085 [Saprospiraceae bacterium]|nr:hypothetical protein [Saprospiraceae bacterium]
MFDPSLAGAGVHTITYCFSDIGTGCIDSCNFAITVEYPQTTFYQDADSDGYGNLAVSILGCTVSVGFVSNSGDCNDENEAIHPDAEEVCNGVDDNCDGLVDNVLLQEGVWSQKADFGGSARNSGVGFSIGSKAYIGIGVGKKDFWEYDPITDIWSQKADFEGLGRYNAVGFSIDARGYIGTGTDGSLKKDFWEYDPSTNIWIQKADFGGTAREAAVGFSIGTKGYIGTGVDGGDKKILGV